MTIKYKLGFTIDSEVMFMLLSKFLPIQDLSVEEVVVPTPDPAIRFDQRFDQPDTTVSKLTGKTYYSKLKRAKQVRRKKGSGYAVNPHAGCNAVLLMFLRDGRPHAFADAIPAVKAAGYSPNGMYGRIERLLRHGYIERIAKGQYQLTNKGIEASKPREEAYVESI